MVRLITSVAFTACLTSSLAFADEPPRLLIVAENHQVASALAPLPETDQ
jgi:hypothetical protein